MLCLTPFPPKQSMPPQNSQPVRFGPYEVDFRAGELRKNGIRIRVQAKPLAVLAALVEAEGRVVSREQLRAALWDGTTFVDFDKNLSTAVNKLREALCDSTESPRYIETVPRRGYRFLMPVERLNLPGQAQPEAPSETLVAETEPKAAPIFLDEVRGNFSEEGTNAQMNRRGFAAPIELRAKNLPEVASPPPPVEPKQVHPPSSVSHHLHYLLSMVAVLVVGLLALVWSRNAKSAARLNLKDSIVLADFSNTTGDAVFDDTLKTVLGISLRQSPFLDVLSEDEVAKALKLMASPADRKVTPQVARDICLRTSSKAYIAGAIGSLGGKYVLELTAVNCGNGDLLGAEQVTAPSKDQILDVLGGAATRLRRGLGESLTTVQRFDVPLEQATTPSLEALNAYSLGQKAAREKGAAESLPYVQRAIELDPNFAMAYAAIGIHYNNLAEPARAGEYLAKAFELRENASERERLKISAIYYSAVTGELDKAAQIYQEMIGNYPRDIAAYNNQGIVFAEQGQYEKALEVTKHGIHLAPDQVTLDENLTDYLLALQRFDEAREVIHETQPRKPDNYIFPAALYALAFLASDSGAMAEQEKWFANKPEYENFGLSLASDTEAFFGRMGESRKLTKRALDSAIRADTKETGAIRQAIAAQREAAYGVAAKARPLAAEAMKLAPASQGTEVEAALAFALAGDEERAERVTQDLEKRFPLDTQVQSLWLPAINAQLALNHNNPAFALKKLQVVHPSIEFGVSEFAANASGSCLYPTYLRGGAYLAAGQGRAAAREFQKILDHSGIVWNCWTSALAHLGIARANALESRAAQGADADAARVRALAAYKDFLTLWKDADPDIPILKQAKADYAKLQ